ncbi:MAG: zf-TFIIB domain-containing protein [Deltaproteobacteria bacterium]|nr:zf-TFIIB domain-containing protein [Deltaproteobacteria bacterium]
MPDATIACVKCNTELEKSIVYDVEVDVCRQCGGIWLDRGEIAALASMPDAELAELRAIDGGAPPARPAKGTLKCPACPGTLVEKVIGAVLVDFCARCQGFHLDRGELDHAVKTARTSGASAKHVLAMAAKALA